MGLRDSSLGISHDDRTPLAPDSGDREVSRTRMSGVFIGLAMFGLHLVAYSDFDGWGGSAIAIPTPFYLLPLTHPFLAWATALAGMLVLMSTRRRRKQPRRPEAIYRLMRRKSI